MVSKKSIYLYKLSFLCEQKIIYEVFSIFTLNY